MLCSGFSVLTFERGTARALILPLWGPRGKAGCESEAASADSVSHTLFPFRTRSGRYDSSMAAKPTSRSLINSSRTFCGCAADAESADDRFEVREPRAWAICGEVEYHFLDVRKMMQKCVEDGFTHYRHVLMPICCQVFCVNNLTFVYLQQK